MTTIEETEPVHLNEAASGFMEGLPDDLRPYTLARSFPRIVNKMAELWRRPAQLDAYFDELLVDERGGRQGFPLTVLFEITALKDHYQTAVFPRQVEAGSWDPRNRV